MLDEGVFKARDLLLHVEASGLYLLVWFAQSRGSPALLVSS